MLVPARRAQDARESIHARKYEKTRKSRRNKHIRNQSSYSVNRELRKFRNRVHCVFVRQ